MTHHVTIVGGGIAGLATAFYLQKKGREAGADIAYTLVESEPRFGGKIVTHKIDGFVIEGGPDSFITQKPWGMQLCRDLGITDRLIPTNDDQRHVFLVQKGKLAPFPGGFTLVPTQFLPFALSPLFSLVGKLRMGMELFIPPQQEDGDESLAHFLRRRLGEEALDKIGPLMAGIYTADPERLSLASTFPRFREMEQKYGSMTKGMQAAKKLRPPPTGSGKPMSMFTSLQGGMNELAEALVDQLDGDLRPGCRVTGLRSLSPGFEVRLDANGETITTDAVVLAVPAFAAADLLAPVAPTLSAQLKAVRYVSSGTVSLGFRRSDVGRQHNFNGFGFMIPTSEDRDIRACTWSSTKFNHRAPDDAVLLRAFVGGHFREHQLDMSDDDLVAMVRSEVAQVMGVTAEPAISRVYRWPLGNPQYDVGHLDRVAEMDALAAAIPGLYLTGSSYRGIGTPDCARWAQETVDRILADGGRETGDGKDPNPAAPGA